MKYFYYFLLYACIFSGCQRQLDINLNDNFLTIDKPSLTLGGNKAAADSFIIRSDIQWTITVSPATDWLQVSKTTGSDTAIIYVTAVSDNVTDSTRKAIITISPATASSVKPVIVTVSQEKGTIKDTLPNVYGGSALDQFTAAVPVVGGGVIAIGYTVSNNGDVTGNRAWEDIWVIKTNVAGKIVWQKTFGGSDRDFGQNIIAAHGGGYILTANVESTDGDVAGGYGNGNVLVIKIDENGTIIWKKNFGGSGRDDCFSIFPTTDGGYVFAGMSGSNDGDATGNHGGSDGWVVKIDGNGNAIWRKVLGGTGYDIFSSVVATTDGGFLAGGQSQSNDGDVSGNHGYDDAWVVKLDGTGNKVWQKTYGGSGYESVGSMVATADGGFVLAGVASSYDGDVTGLHGDKDAWVWKIGATGNITWQKTLGGTQDDEVYSIIKTFDNGYAVAGDTKSQAIDVTYKGGFTDGWVIKLDISGNQVAQKLLGGTDEDYGNCIIETSAGSWQV